MEKMEKMEKIKMEENLKTEKKTFEYKLQPFQKEKEEEEEKTCESYELYNSNRKELCEPFGTFCNIYRFHKIYMSFLKLSFCIINFKETIFISVNDESNMLSDFQVAYPLEKKYVHADNSICLIGDTTSYGNDIARLLTAKYEIPFYISVNVEERDENLTNFIFLHCTDFLKKHLKKGEEKKGK